MTRPGLLPTLALLLIATGAHADLTEPGFLSVGSYTVIAGTAAIQGNAFSVGGTTFVVDSGVITMAAEVRGRGPAIYSSTLTLTNPVMNDWNLVGASSFTGVSSAYFYGFSSTVPYRGFCQLRNYTAGDLSLRVDDDTGANYEYHAWVEQGSNGLSWGAANAATSVPLNYAGSVQIASNTPMVLKFETVSSAWNQPKKVKITVEALMEYDSTNHILTSRTQISHLGTANFNSIKVYKSAGTISGRCFWEQFYSSL